MAWKRQKRARLKSVERLESMLPSPAAGPTRIVQPDSVIEEITAAGYSIIVPAAPARPRGLNGAAGAPGWSPWRGWFGGA
jgi:hypothetical protein